MMCSNSTRKPLMNRTARLVSNSVFLIVPFGLFMQPLSADAADWKPLFDGKSLAGWKADRHAGNFSIVDGVLKTHGRDGMSHLFYVGESDDYVRFKDFELELEARAEPSSNSGIFFHTDWELRKKKYLNRGYELQLNSTEKEKKKTGSLYAVVDLPTSPVDETEWFRVRLSVKGKRIQAWLNGEQVLDYTEPQNVKRPTSRAKRLISPTGGAIALQAHDPQSVFYFRGIRIRELD